MKIVLDTNIWLSGLFWKGEAYNLIGFIVDRKIEVVISKDILMEILKVLNREAKFQRFITDRRTSIEELIRTITSICKLVFPVKKITIIKEDTPDNKILEAALEGHVDYIISYDSHLLKIREFKGIRIIKPEDFMNILNKMN